VDDKIVILASGSCQEGFHAVHRQSWISSPISTELSLSAPLISLGRFITEM